MIQINLLPDVKQQLIAARRTRNLVVSASILAGLVGGGLILLLVLLLGAQVLREELADNKIKDEYAKLSSVEDIDDLVTIQNQLTQIDTLHDQKIIGSRMFLALQAINPGGDNAVQFTSAEVSPSDMTMTLEGTASAGFPALEALEKTIKNTKFEYSLSDSEDGSETVSESFADTVTTVQQSYGESSDGSRVLIFSIVIDHNDNLFSNTAKNARIVAPTQEIDVTDSRTRIPASLFGQAATSEEDE